MPGEKSGKAKKREQQKAQVKAQEKFATKIVEDKTFGLKNKNKSKKVQQYVNQVKKVYTGTNDKIEEEKRRIQREKKNELERQKKEMEELMKVVIEQPKPKFGEDPKSILCQFFKVGKCKKGDKCKFSHDLNIENKAAKRSLYTDTRDDKKEEENMENWDQETLEKVIEENAKQIKNQSRSKTICKYFLDAIEREVYGWFWKCPNGGNDCPYRHALPEGFIFKTRKQKELEASQKAELSAVDKELLQLEKLEELRAHLPTTGLTPVTPETFAKWKEDRIKKREEDRIKAASDQANNNKVQQQRGLSGRDLFSYDPSLFVDDEEAADNKEYDVIEEEENDDDNDEINKDEGEDGIAPPAPYLQTDGPIDETLFEEEDLDDLPDDDDDEEGEDEGGESKPDVNNNNDENDKNKEKEEGEKEEITTDST